jgi:hypothetical protein
MNMKSSCESRGFCAFEQLSYEMGEILSTLLRLVLPIPCPNFVRAVCL